MQPTLPIDGHAYSSSVRAEDGRQPSHWYNLYEGVVLPLGSLVAVFFCMIAIMALAK